MPTWGEILTELNKSSTPASTPDYDRVRRQYLQLMRIIRFVSHPSFVCPERSE